jgi:hypothetical protein
MIPAQESVLRSSFACFALTILASLLAACGGGGGGSIEQETITGKVIDGYVANAIVCIDLNQNGRCDSDEPQTRSDAAGVYQLSIAKGAVEPLLAEVIAGESRDADQPGVAATTSYRMASPSRNYSTNITPFTTLVQLCGEADMPLAESLVRNVVGLPPQIDINVDYTASPGSMTQSVAKSVAAALKSAGMLDMSSTDSMRKVTAQLPAALTDLPVLRIRTKDGAPIVSKEVYLDATFTLTNPAVSGEAMPLNGKIRGRGHSTWGQPKNPYKIQFKDDASYAKIADFVGMKKNRNWALLADYFDRSLIRNKLAFSLGNSSVFAAGLKWTPSGQHVEVYLNDDYVGVYLLTEDIRIDPARLNIKKMSKDLAVNDLDGGYIVQVDARLDCYNVGDMNLQHHTPRGVPVCVDRPDEADITLPQLAYVKNLVDGVEAEIFGANGMLKINPVSFVDWYLLNEVVRNHDAAFWSSVYLWKDTDAAANPLDRLLNMGPIWDFDLSGGNANYNDAWKPEGCWVSKTLTDWPNWYTRLFDNDDFVAMTIARWKLKRPALETFINTSIDTYAARLQAAQQRNFTRWPILGQPMPLSGYYTFYTWADEVSYLKRFLDQRMAWLDQAYASPESFKALCR